MRRRILLILLPLLLLAGLAAFLLRGRPPVQDVAGLLPADTIVLVQWHDLAGMLHRLRQSPLGHALAAIDWHKALAETSPELAPSLARLRQDLDLALESPLLPELFGQECALALIPAALPAVGTPRQSRPGDNLVLLLRPRTQAALLQSLAPLFAGELRIVEERHQGMSMRRYIQHGETLCFSAVVQGWLLVSRAPEPLVRLGRPPIAGQTLASRQDFQEEHKALGSEWCFRAHGDIPRLWREVLADDSPPPLRRLDLAGFRRPGERRLLVRLRREPGQESGLSSLPWTPPPAPHRTLADAPGDLIAYGWCNWLGPTAWEGFFASDLGEHVSRWIHVLQQTTDNPPPPPWSRLLGDQVALLVTDLPGSILLPVPQMAVMVEVRDPAGLKQRLAPLLREIPLQRETVAGAPATVLRLANGFIQPAMAQQDKVFVLADSRNQLHNILENGRARPLIDEPQYRAVLPRREEPDGLLLFVRLQALHASLQRVLPQVAWLLSKQEEGDGPQTARMIDTVVMPLLAGARNFQVQGVRGRAEGDILTLESILLLEENQEATSNKEGTH